MTKKDFEFIADKIRVHVETAHERKDAEAVHTLHNLADDLAGWLKIKNPKFSRNKFMRACGLNPSY